MSDPSAGVPENHPQPDAGETPSPDPAPPPPPEPDAAAPYPPPPDTAPPPPPPSHPPPVQGGPARPANGMGLAALVLGVSGLAISWVPFLGCLGWIAGVLAIVFGALGLGKAKQGRATNRTSALAGLVTGIAALVLGLGTAMAFGIFAESAATEKEAVQEDRSAAGEPAAEATSDPSDIEPEAAEAPAGIGDGQWEVGAEIAPGTYVTWSEGLFGCYVARLGGFGGELDDIIANTNLADGARGRITIAEDDAGVEFSGGCEWTPATDANLADAGGEFGAGLWEVGTEIQPGTYTTQAEGEGVFDGCYVARLSGFGMGFDDIVANNNVEGGAQGRIEIADSDAGVEFSGDCVWTLS